MILLSTRNLRKTYGARVGLDGLDLDLEEGVACGLLGPNGVGKSTALRLLLGFLKPTGGTARLFALDCWRHGKHIRRDVGYLPGDLRLYSWLTPRSALRLFGKMRRADLLARGAELAERFRLELDVPVRNMSRGMRQKLGLILALAPAPRLLILDEPTSALDPLLQEEVLSCLGEMVAGGCTVLFSSHTLSEVERLCQRVVILRGGRVAADTTIEELRARARRELVLHWKHAEAARDTRSPDDLVVLNRDDRRWVCALRGAVTPLLPWLSRQPLEDVSLGKANLETLFHSYYREDER